MAITKIWAVKDDLNRVLNYIKNPDKTKEDMSDGLKEVLSYTTQGYKTNEKEFITGINCEPRTALKQMMNTKLSYNKMDGRLAFHAVQSFKPGEVTPDECHSLGVQLAKQMWGNRFEVVVSTHLDKEHLHNHFVINSVSWVDGKKYDNKKVDIDHFRELNDVICKEHGLTVISKPDEKAMNYGEWKAEKNDSIYLRKLIRYDVDSVLLYARTPEQFQASLEEIGYVVNLSGKHWTLKHPQSKRTFRFYKLTRDNRYDEEHLMERINSNFLFPMQSSVPDVIPCKEYQGNHRKLKGIKAMYIRYCFELGILKPKGIPQKYPSPALRKDLIYMDKITDENTFIGKHNLETVEDVLAFKLELNNQIENWMNQRRSIYNKIKRCRNHDLKQQLEQDRDTLTSKIAHGKKEIRICEDIEKRVPDIEEKLKMVNALENGAYANTKRIRKELEFMNSADTADQMMKMTLEGIQVAAEIGLKAGGTAAKSLAVTLYAIISDNKKIKGKTNLDNLLKSGKELKVFAIHHKDLEKFCIEAKHYGVLYSVLKEKNNTDGIVDIMVKAEDASKISRMVDKFDLATIDTKAIRESVLSQKDIKPMSDEEHDALLSKLMDEKTNPDKARTSKDGTPFEPSSKTLKKENKKKTVERKKSTATMDRPSVRQELKDIKQQQLNSSAPKYPVRKKSKKKVR